MTTTATPGAAPAAPAAPAPAAPAATAAQAAPEAPRTDTLDADIARRLDAFMASKPAAPPAAPGALPPDATPVVFDPTTDGSLGVAEANAAQAAAPADSAAPVADAQATDAQAAAPAIDVAPFTVDLPPRNPGGKPIQIVAPDADTADAMRRMSKGYLRGEEHRTKLAELAQRETQVAEVEALLQADPIGLLASLPAAAQLAVAESLMLQHFDALAPKIADYYNDEGARRLALADAREQRMGAREQFQTQVTMRQQVSAVRSAVDALIPEAAGNEDAAAFRGDALRFLADYARTADLSPKDVPHLLASYVTRYGFAPSDPAPADASRTAPVAAPAAPAAAPAGPRAAAAPQAAAPQPPQPIPVQRLTPALMQQRAAAAAVASVGAGASPARIPTAPKGLTVEQAADWLGDFYKARAGA